MENSDIRIAAAARTYLSGRLGRIGGIIAVMALNDGVYQRLVTWRATALRERAMWRQRVAGRRSGSNVARKTSKNLRAMFNDATMHMLAAGRAHSAMQNGFRENNA